MSRKTTIGCLVALGALALSGCLREDASYILREDNQVDGVIVLALHNDYAGDPPDDTLHDAAMVASKYAHATVTALGQPNWTGDRITFTDEPIGTFAAAVENWDITVARSGSQYVVTGTVLDPADEETKQTVTDNDGSSVLKVTFPGEVYEHNGSRSGRTVTWNLLTITEAPYARGSAVPDAPPEPEPDPVVTIVVTPDPVVTPSASLSASPSPTAVEPPLVVDDGEGSIPVWVWVVGGILVAALAGMIGFTLANRKPPTPVATPIGKAKGISGEEEMDESEPEDDVMDDEEPDQGPPTKKPSPKKT